MVKIREEQTERLEDAASKGLKFGGFKNMKLGRGTPLILLVRRGAYRHLLSRTRSA